jgi:hypothetical protein
MKLRLGAIVVLIAILACCSSSSSSLMVPAQRPPNGCAGGVDDACLALLDRLEVRTVSVTRDRDRSEVTCDCLQALAG